jgi:hypothetical protein
MAEDPTNQHLPLELFVYPRYKDAGLPGLGLGIDKIRSFAIGGVPPNVKRGERNSAKEI